MYVCGGGEEKRKAWDTWVVGKKMGSGVYVYDGKKERVEKERRK